jgi:transcriptional regulator GlxA family with amidase domain
VLTFIEENIDKTKSRGDLADIANLSETRFHYVFKNTMGISPMAHVRLLRMKKAQMLLMQTEMNVNDVGEKVGYSDIFHFSKVFKQAFGISPLQYRKSLQQWIAGGRP